MVEISLPRRIYYNESIESVLPQVLSTFNVGSVVVVTDKNVEKLGFFNKILNSLKSIKYSIYDDVEPEPPIDIGDKIAKVINEVNAEAVIAVGGGSVIDAAKAGVIRSKRPDVRIEDIAPFNPLNIELKKPLLIAIPTTSGTGSDSSYALVLTKYEKGRRIKIDVANPEVVPSVVILDPEIPRGMPKSLTIGTALDALTHALESIVSTDSNPFTDALALKVIEIVFDALPKVLSTLEDIDLRARLHIAATMAGIAFSNSGLGLAHALGHPLGAALHLHHGTVVGLLLPYVVDYNYGCPEAAEKYGYVKKLLEASLGFEPKERLSDHIRDLYRKIGFPLRLRDLGVDKRLFDSVKTAVIEETLHDPTLAYNPVIPSPEDLESLLDSLY